MATLVNIATRVGTSLRREGWGKTAKKGVSLVWCRLLTWPGVLHGYLDYLLNPRALRVPKGTDWPYDPQAVRAKLEQNGVMVESYHVDVTEFKCWWQATDYLDKGITYPAAWLGG